MLVGKQEQVPPQAAPMPGAKGAFIQWLMARDQGAAHFYMRRIVLEPGGVVPAHEHPEEHEIYVLGGRGRVEAEGEAAVVGPGDFVFIPGGQRHSFTNVGQEELAFICCINARGE